MTLSLVTRRMKRFFQQSKLKIYKESVKLIKESNEVNKSYTLGLSTFADMSDEEFNKLYDISNSLKIR